MTTTITPITRMAPPKRPRPKLDELIGATSGASLSLGAPKSIMIYGMAGTGKTTLAASIIEVPDIDYIAVIDVEQGGEVLAALQDAYYEGAITVEAVDVTQLGAFERINFLIHYFCDTDRGVQAVIFDTLDVAQKEAEKHFQKLYATSGKGGTPDGFAVWRKLAEWTDWVVRSLHNNPNFVAIITCHAKEQTKEEGPYRVLPNLMGSSKDTIGSIPSIVAYNFAKEAEGDTPKAYITMVGPSEKMITKTRFKLPDAMRNITMGVVYNLIETEKNAAVAAYQKVAA